MAKSSVRDKAQAMSGAGLLVVASMCLALLLAVVTACVLAIKGDPVPDGLDRVLNGLLVGVPALLAKSYRDLSKADEVQPVEVVNHPDDPVPTTEAAPDLDAPPADVLPLAAETSSTISSRPSRRRT